MTVHSDWRKVQVLNERIVGIPYRIQDYLAVRDVLRLCVSGLSNDSIAEQLVMFEDYVQGTIRHYLQFDGWDEDLEASPLRIYRKCGRMFPEFMVETKEFEFWRALEMFTLCEVYEAIDTEIIDYYESED